MRSAPASTRALRIGVVLGETVIDERTLRAPASFSIGRSMRNTIAVPVAGLPRSWPLLTMTADGVLVRLAEGMDIRLASTGAVLTRADLAAGATRHRDHIAFVVRPGSHGKIELGEVRVLFQEVALPPVAPRPTLPRSVRGSFVDRIDRRVATFAAISILGHASVMVAAHLHDGPGDGIVDRAAQASYVPETLMVIDADQLAYLDPVPTPDAPATPTPPGTATPTPTPSQGTATPTPRPPRPDGRPPTAPVGLPEDATRYAEELFASTPGGASTGGMNTRRPSSDLDRQLAELAASGAKASIGGGPDRLRGDGTPRLGTVPSGPVVDGPTGPVAVNPDKGEQVPPGRIIPVPPPRIVGGADVAGIIRKIGTSYLSGLQRCYKKSLGGDATLAGKVTLTFTVTDRGATTDTSARGVDPAIESCVEGLMQKWTFTPAVDEDGDATDVDLKMALQMTPT